MSVEAHTVGFGKSHREFWLNSRPDMPPVPEESGTHVCLRAPNEEAVQAFHRAALEAGGRDNGGPGPRPQYSETYYGAFVRDPDGHRIEAVTFLSKA
jgi:catechol 2,3-dioxygenase-like lactoylglutathione lyase family enzyme